MVETKIPKQATAFRLTKEARALLAAMASKYGISQAAIVELAVREKAEREKVSSK